MVGPKPGLGSAMPRRRIAVDQATGLADLPDDVIRLVLRWCSASTLSRVRVNRRFTAAVSAEAESSVNEIGALWPGDVSFTTRISAAISICRLAPLCGRVLLVPRDFHTQWQTCVSKYSLGVYKTNLHTDYRALQLVYLVVGGSNLQPQMVTSDAALRVSLCSLAMRAAAYAEYTRQTHIDFAKVKAALVSMKIEDYDAKVPLNRTIGGKTREQLRLDAEQVRLDADDSDDEDYAPSEVSEESEADDMLGLTVEGAWRADLEAFFDDNESYDDLYAEDVSILQMGFLQDPGGTQCGNRVCCHLLCECRLADEIYSLAEELTLSENEELPFVCEDLEALVNEHVHSIISDPAYMGKRPRACAHAVMQHRRLLRFEAWRCRGLANPPEVALELQLNVLHNVADYEARERAPNTW